MAGQQELPYRRRDLIDTRKRQRSASPTPIPNKMARAIPGDAELRRIVYGHRIPNSIFERLESRWIELKDEAAKHARDAASNAKEASKSAARGIEIGKRCNQIHDLKTEIEGKEKVMRKLQERNGESGKLRAEKKDLEEFIETQNQLIEIGTSALRDQRMKVGRLEEENEGLKGRVEELETENGHFQDLVGQMGEAEGEELVGLALEAQAMRTLGMVKGLQREVEEKDAREARRVEEIVRYEQQILEERRKVTEAEQKKQEQAKLIEELREEVEAARLKAKEAENIAEEEGRLIKRLLELK
ncbi:uncharacterized protein MYCFIDRAFT_78149 [Pseudocercospora fijiensis CIRAD86]|uniref:Uncharacterized protein n=1 Tax=Pseudocercospora fijiensis (strain CIRAD86) TaxID=383855 RepID=M2ZMS5_PSEFD|nr:uncharacterized protein MYCFIDRAFT_78149 [Pseudocercospora fijiensis CIRAD86]EME80409.1 hypothetical protein MYCFIDRAFT_78149 [Pseudocercospora fijiensis CIRAD86]